MALKILMATMSLDIGGAETHIVELSKELRRNGNEVVVVSNGGVYVSELADAGIRHYCAPMHRRNIFSMIKSYFLLRRVIQREKPDIVHAHARIPALICATLHKSMGFPFVTTAHGVFDTGFGLRLFTNWGRKTIAVSEDIKEYLISNYGVYESNIIVTVNGIDTEKFSPEISGDDVAAEFGLDRTRPVISFVSRMDDDIPYVAELLIDLVPQLDRSLPGVQILMAGGGNVFEKLKAKANEANQKVGRRIVFMAGSRTDINQIIAAGDLFVGVSRAALEAMASSKPVIVAGKEGYIGLFTRDKLLVSQKTNFCCRGCEQATKELLHRDIVRCLTELSPDELMHLGSYGREVILAHYSVRKMTEDCQIAYNAVRKKRFNVVMSGYYGFNNSGDEAILYAIHQNIEQSGADTSITVLSNNPPDTKRRYGYNAIYRFWIPGVFLAIRKCDVLISGGGSLLQDRTSTRSILYYLMIIRMAEHMGKKVMLYANGIGPVGKIQNRSRVKHAIEQASIVTLRDKNSATELRDMGVVRDDLIVTADPVFTLNSIPAADAEEMLQANGIPMDKPFVGVSIRYWTGMESFCGKTAVLCDEIHKKYGYNIVFIVMQTPYDVDVSRKVQELMESPSYILQGWFRAPELMGMIGCAEFILAMRLHTLIFAARMGVPLLGMVYDPKVSYYLDTLEMPSVGSVENIDTDSALLAIRDVAENRETYAQRLRNKSLELEAAAHNDEQYLVDLLKR